MATHERPGGICGKTNVISQGKVRPSMVVPGTDQMGQLTNHVLKPDVPSSMVVRAQKRQTPAIHDFKGPALVTPLVARQCHATFGGFDYGNVVASEKDGCTERSRMVASANSNAPYADAWTSASNTGHCESKGRLVTVSTQFDGHAPSTFAK